MLVERRNGPMFYVTINPTVNSTAKDYKRSFNSNRNYRVFIVTRSLKIADHESRERFAHQHHLMAWPHMPNLSQLVQRTSWFREQVPPTAMIRYMVVV